MARLKLWFFRCLLLGLPLVHAAQPKLRTITVGYGGNFAFDPEITHADVGDIVTFRFFPSNHSVVRGEYVYGTTCGSLGCNPCVPYELLHEDQQGFHSGNILTQTASMQANVFQVFCPFLDPKIC
jgi:plastocyanin